MAKPRRPWVVGSVDLVAQFFGVHRRTVNDWVAEGMPRTQRGGRYDYDLAAITGWIRERDRRQVSVSAGIDPDLDGAGVNSPALEEYRRQRARKAKVEADLAERQAVSLDEARDGFARVAGILRKAGEAQRRLSPECHQILEDSLGECARAIEEAFGDSSGDPNDDDADAGR